MQRRSVRSACLLVSTALLGGCGPSLAGLAAARQGGDKTTVVNPTLAVTAPAAYVGAATLDIAGSTTPAGLPVEANLDDAGWHRVTLPWHVTGLADGAHSAKLRVVEAPATQRTLAFTVDTVQPAAPTNVAVTSPSAGRLAVTWTAGSDGGSGLEHYTVRYGTTSGSLAGEQAVDAPAISTSVPSLDACERYYVTVSCSDRAGNASSTTTEVDCRVSCGGDGTFAAATAALGGAVDAVAQGDFDGDGILDLAVGAESTLQILLGNGSGGRGDGTFTAGTTYACGSWISAIQVADLDADHIQDLLVLNATAVRIFAGQGSDGRGDGTFAAGQTVTSSLVTPQALLAKDLDGDHIVDLVVGDWSGNRLVFFTGVGSGGRGDGTFTYSHQMTTGTSPGAIVAGDFDGDAIADLAVACQGNSEALVTHLGNGTNGRPDGTFAAKQTWLSGGFVAGDVLVADFNADGVDDLVLTLSIANAVCFMQGVGNGTFYIANFVGVGTRPWGLLSGDFNGDHIPDFASISYLDEGVSLLTASGAHGRGDGDFTVSAAGGDGQSLFHGVVGDYDANGSPDMVLGSLDGGYVVLQNHGSKAVGDGTFVDRDADIGLTTTAFGVGAADLDSDHVPDLMVASYQTPTGGGSDYVLQYLNPETNGLGSGVLTTGQLLFTGSGPTAFAFGDFDADGITDIAVLASDIDWNGGGNRVDVLIGAGSGGVGTGGVASQASYAVGINPRGIVAGDFDADGILDLAVTNSHDDTVQILLGDGSGGRGDGTFTAQTAFVVATGPFAIATGDFDADGILDLVIGCSSGAGDGTVQVLIGQGTNGLGDGTFAVGATLPTSHVPVGLGVGDFDADGILDVVATQLRLTGGTSTSGFVLFTGNGSGGRGDGTFTAGSEVAIGGNPFGLTVGDFNADHVLDVAVTDAESAHLAVLLGNGTNGVGNGTFASAVSVTIGSDAVAVTAVDLDCDGVLDLVAAGQSTVSIRYGGGAH